MKYKREISEKMSSGDFDIVKKFETKKSLGQNFLNNKDILELIAKSADVKTGELVLEVGPGEGALTEYLLKEVSHKEGNHLFCIEKDHRLIDILNNKFEKDILNKKIGILEEDILKWGIDEYLEDSKVGGEDAEEINKAEVDIKKGNTSNKTKYKLIANIPYYITGAIIEKFLSAKNKPEKIVIMVQKEVADRVTNKKNIKGEEGKGSILSLATKLYGESKILKVVKPGNFNPPPKIDSAVLEINLYPDLYTKYNFGNREDFDFAKFEKKYLLIIKAGLANKRKMLLPNLKNNLKEIEMISVLDWDKIFENLNIDKKIRGEDLTFDKWLEIIEEVSRN